MSSKLKSEMMEVLEVGDVVEEVMEVMEVAGGLVDGVYRLSM